MELGLYQHYKGKLYLVLGVGQMSGTEDDPKATIYVVYVPLYPHRGSGIILRPASEFREMLTGTQVIENGVLPQTSKTPRFKYVGNYLSEYSTELAKEVWRDPDATPSST